MSPACFLTRAARLSLVLVRVVLFNNSCVNISFLFVAAAARLVKYPSRGFMFSPAPSCCVLIGMVQSYRDVWTRCSHVLAPLIKASIGPKGRYFVMTL